jgi:hypothetical protein
MLVLKFFKFKNKIKLNFPRCQKCQRCQRRSGVPLGLLRYFCSSLWKQRQASAIFSSFKNHKLMLISINYYWDYLDKFYYLSFFLVLKLRYSIMLSRELLALISNFCYLFFRFIVPWNNLVFLNT